MRAVHMLVAAATMCAVASCGHNKPGGSAPVDAAAETPGDAGVGPDAGDSGFDGAPAANVIRVTTPDDLAIPGDRRCSLREAIAMVNAHAAGPGGDCGAWTEQDVIELPTGTITIAATIQPTTTVELRGAGMRLTTLAFTDASASCGVHLATDDALVRLTGLTLRPAEKAPAPAAMTGLCVNKGSVYIRHVRATAFTAGGLRIDAKEDESAILRIYNSLIDGNSNAESGGGIALLGATAFLSMHQTAVVGNSSAQEGGGMFSAGGDNATYLMNTTFAQNSARVGGGIAARILDVTYFGVYWSTIADNHATEVAGGMYVHGETLDAHGTVSFSIVAGNTAGADAAQANLNSDWAPGFTCTLSMLDLAAFPTKPVSIRDSCRYDLAGADADPRLGPLMDMGGVDHLPVFPLLPGSAAIDAADSDRPDGIVEQRDWWNGPAGDPPIGTDADNTPPWMLFGRDKSENPVFDQGSYEFNPHWEAETLTVAATASGDAAPTTTPAGLAHGAGMAFTAARTGAFVVYQVPVPETGGHAVTLGVATGPDGGRFQLLVADSFTGAYRAVGDVQDSYAATPGLTTLDMGGVQFASFGQKFVRLVVLEPNSASTGNRIVLDYLTVTKQ